MDPSPAPLPAGPVRLAALDVLRGACAGIVFLSHWHLWSRFAPDGALENATHRVLDLGHSAFAFLTWPDGGHHPAVIAFFVLSGFCIHYPHERRMRLGAPAPRWTDYFRRRFLRIMPVYWAACALGFAFVLAEAIWPSGNPLLALHAYASVTDTVVRFTGLAGLYPREIFAGNYILTTVTVEMLMYAVYPLIYSFAARGQWFGLGLGFVAMHLVAILLLPFITPFWVFNSIFMLGLFWFAGAWAAHLFLAGRAHISRTAVLATWAVFLALKVTPHFYGLNLLKQAGWGAVCTLGLLWAIRREGQPSASPRAAGMPALQWLGDISYSLYAMHTPAIMLATWGLVHAGVGDYLIQLLATMTLSLGAVLGVHYGIERVFYPPRRAGPVVATA